jgi:hypothetical protein
VAGIVPVSLRSIDFDQRKKQCFLPQFCNFVNLTTRPTMAIGTTSSLIEYMNSVTIMHCMLRITLEPLVDRDISSRSIVMVIWFFLFVVDCCFVGANVLLVT